jgi:hypothetical protein
MYMNDILHRTWLEQRKCRRSARHRLKCGYQAYRWLLLFRKTRALSGTQPLDDGNPRFRSVDIGLGGLNARSDGSCRRANPRRLVARRIRRRLKPDGASSGAACSALRPVERRAF